MTNTIVIGAGPAGLAVGACLQRAGDQFLILEQADRVGPTWHQHYDRLHLHSDKAHSFLPHFPFPKKYPRYPSRLQVVEYLEAYRQHFQLGPLFGQQVQSARFQGQRWEVTTQNATYNAPHLVVATGYNREPNIPEWPGQTSFRGVIFHSSAYKNGASFKNKKVLVVGFGNSGGEIVIDLWESGAMPAIAVRSPVNVIPRDIFGIPVLALGVLLNGLPPRLADALNAPLLRFLVGDLTRYGLRRQPYGPLFQIQKDGRIPLIDVGTVKLIKQGHLLVYPGIERFTEEEVWFVDGRRAKFDAVVLATGYRPRVGSYLMAAGACDAEGIPLGRGKEESTPGLYFCGFKLAPTGMLREIGLEAMQISADIIKERTELVMVKAWI